MQQALTDAFAGRAGVIVVEGPAGIGKTALCAQLGATAQAAGAVVLWGRCLEEPGAPAYWPWRQMVCSHARSCTGGGLAALLGRGLLPIAAVVPELADLLPPAAMAAAATTGPADSAQARFELFHAFSSFWQRAARQQPILLILDDLHWADPTSLRLLAFIAGQLADEPLCVLATCRDGERPRAHPLSEALADLTRSATFQRLTLGGLSASETAQFVARAVCTGEVATSADLAETLFARTEGHPLYLQETVRLLADPGGDALLALKTIPPGVRAVIGKRLNGLSDSAQKLLAMAACIGREFDLALLAELDGAGRTEGRDDTLFSAIEQALVARLIEPMAAAQRYRFSHALVRDTLYEELLGPRRTLLHRRIGECLERQHEDDLAPYWSHLAHHYGQSAWIGTAARALDCAQRAARRARAQLAFEEAARLVRQALDLQRAHFADAGELRCDLLLALGEACLAHGAGEPGLEPFHEAATLAQTLGAGGQLAQAAIGFELSTVLSAQGDLRAVTLLVQALHSVGDTDPGLRVELLASLCRAHTYNDQPDEAEGVYQRAVAEGRALGEPWRLIRALTAISGGQYWPGWLARRTAAGAEAFALARRAHLPSEVVRHQSAFYGCDLLRAGQTSAWHELYDYCMPEAAGTHNLFAQLQLIHLQTLVALNEGRFTAAEALARQALEQGRPLDEHQASTAYGLHMFALRRQQGRLREVLPMLRHFVSNTPAATTWRPGLAVLYAELDMPEDSRREYEEVMTSRPATLPRGAGAWTIAGFMAEVCAALGDTTHAAYLYGLLLPQSGANLVADTAGPCLGATDRLLGMLATVLGQWEGALRHFDAAMLLDEQCGARVWLAHSRYQAALMLSRRAQAGDAARALTLLEAVGAEVATLGMAALAARAEALQQRLSLALPDGQTTAPALTYPCGLTAREVEVLRLVAIGRNNRDVGQVLAISTNTVANHMRSILNKTYTANRTEAAAFARDQRLLDG